MTWKGSLPWSLTHLPHCFHIPSVWLPYCRTPGAIHITAYEPGLPGVVQCTAAAAVGAGLDFSVSSRNTSCILTPPCFCLCSFLCLCSFSFFSSWGALVLFQASLNHSLLWEPLLNCHSLQKSSCRIPRPHPIASVNLPISSLFTCLCSPLDCVFLKHHDLVFVISEFPEPQQCQFNGEFFNEYSWIEWTKFLFTCCLGVI